MTTDDGGKTFSKKIEVSVTPDPHENFLVKFTVNYVEEGDVGAEYNTSLANSKAAYETFLGRMFDSMDVLDNAIDAVFSSGSEGSQSISGPPSSELTGSESGSEGSPNYEELFSTLQSSAVPIIEASEAGTFSVTYPVASGDDWKMTINGDNYATDPNNAYGGKSGTDQTIDYFDPKTWTVADGFESIELFKGSTKVISVTVTDTTMLIKGEAGFASSFSNGDVGAISLQGDFSKTNMDEFFDILDQLSVDQTSSSSSSSSSSSGEPFSSSHSSSGSSGSSYSSSSSSGPNYTIDKVLVYGKDSSSDGLTDAAVAQAEIAQGALSLTVGDYTMSLISQDLPDYITAGDLFDFANVDLLDVEEVIKDGVDGLFTLSHSTHGELVIIESDMSSAPAGGTVTIGDGDTFGTYEGNRFVSDSNDIVAAYFDFGDLVVSDAQFQNYWESIEDITDMFTDIA